MSNEEDRASEIHREILYALAKRLGGQAIIAETELPTVEYSIMRRRLADGGIEIRIVDVGLAS